MIVNININKQVMSYYNNKTLKVNILTIKFNIVINDPHKNLRKNIRV